MADENGFDPVPYAVNGGTVDADNLRIAAHDGSEGVLTATDLKVHALSPAGPQVAIDPGAARILNRSQGGANQTYTVNARELSKLDVLATGPVGRSDMVIVRIEDPQYAPWPEPPEGEEPNYQYTVPIVIPNVSATAAKASDLNLNYSAIALARIDIPANTTVITDAMIKPMRKVARPRRQREVRVFSPAGASVSTLNDTNGNRIHFPLLTELVPCPEWATEVKMVVTVGNLLHKGDITGHMRAEYGWNGVDPYLATEFSGIHHVDNTSVGEGDRVTLVIGGELKIPAAFRGKSHYVRTGSVGNDGSSGSVKADEWVSIVVDLEFVEVAD